MKGTELGGVFADVEVAALYRYRAPYPREVFEILEQLVVEPRTVLDAGAGTGALARNFPRSITRIDAVDPSASMIAHGRALPGGDDPRIRWIFGGAEEAPEGEQRTQPGPFDQSVDDYLRLLGSTSTLSRSTLGARAGAFEAECRALFARHGMERIRSDVVGYVALVTPT